jgi:hypothetical protein
MSRVGALILLSIFLRMSVVACTFKIADRLIRRRRCLHFAGHR